MCAVFFRLFLLPGLLLLAAHAAECCTIPVFRYALDRWEADQFHLILPADAAQDTALQDLLRPLRANGKANLEITTSRDLTQKDALLRDSRGSDRPLWGGRLDKAALDAVLDSPARRKIIEGVLSGGSVLWVIADSGSVADSAETGRIETRLQFLEQVAALPIQDPNDPDSQLGPGPPLKLKFTTLRLKRDDPAETLLLRMLAGPKGEIDPAQTSFAAAVFGRGRVLGAWPLEQLDDRTLEDVNMFLIGRCSCRMKSENPGWDVLLNVDWEKELGAASSTTTSQAENTPAVMAAPEVVSITAKGDQAQAALDLERIIGSLVLGVVLIVLLARMKRKSPQG